MGGIPIKGSDSQNYTTRTETGADGQETQIVSDKGVLGALTRLFNVLRFFSFDPTSQLRVTAAGTVGISSGTVTTVGTVTTGNMGIGDMGKPATSLMMGRQSYAMTTKSAFKRS